MKKEQGRREKKKKKETYIAFAADIHLLFPSWPKKSKDILPRWPHKQEGSS